MSNSSNPPKAYQTGIQDFYGRNFIVTPDVLIPRPETEAIIDLVLNLAGKPYLPGVKPSQPELPEHPTIIDVGTGSGCIAITLKLELPKSKIIATDISENALIIAQKNATKLSASISFIISHLIEKVNVKPDLVVANLPYVDKKWDWLDLESLSYEPETALFAEDSGLALIKELIREVSAQSIPRLILEADPCEHDKIIDYAKKYNLRLKTRLQFTLYFTLND